MPGVFFIAYTDPNEFTASLCGIPSFVEITAKLDTYVGFLPYDALERLLEKRPIVLLTLAKRLISLLSPLGEKYTFMFATYRDRRF